MARVLLVGYDPETVDYSDPALPPALMHDWDGRSPARLTDLPAEWSRQREMLGFPAH
jgi:hypothetical protein